VVVHNESAEWIDQCNFTITVEGGGPSPPSHTYDLGGVGPHQQAQREFAYTVAELEPGMDAPHSIRRQSPSGTRRAVVVERRGRRATACV